MHGRVYKSETKKIERCFANLAFMIRSIEGRGRGRAGQGRKKERDALRFSICMSCCVKVLYLRGLIANKETRACARGPKITLPQITMKLISITEVQRDVVLRSARLSRIRYYPWVNLGRDNERLAYGLGVHFLSHLRNYASLKK